MRINKKTRYTVDILVYIYKNQDEGKYVMLKEACDFYGISIEHGRKVVQLLKSLNYIDSKQGIQGGLRINVEAEEVDFYKIIMETENIQLEKLEICYCEDCPSKYECNFNQIVYSKMKDMIDSFQGITLANFL